MSSASARPRTAVLLVAVVALVATLLPALPAAAATPASVGLAGLPSTVSVGQRLTILVTDVSPSGGPYDTTQVQFSIPQSWTLDTATAASPGGPVSFVGPTPSARLDPAVPSVTSNTWDFTIGDGGVTTSGGGATLLSVDVIVGNSPTGGSFEVLDANVGTVNAYARTTIEEVWDVRQPNVVSTGATYPLVITNQSLGSAALSTVELDVPEGLVLSPAPHETEPAVGGRQLVRYFLGGEVGLVVPSGDEALVLDVVAATPSRADGNGALEIVHVDLLGFGGELLQEAESFSFVEHSVRVAGPSVLETGDVRTYSLADARGTITKDGFPNSSMGTQRVQLLLPDGVSYVPGSASAGTVTTGAGTVTFEGPFTTLVGETLLTFQLSYDGTNPGLGQPVDVLSTPTAPSAPVYDSTLRTPGDSKLFALDLTGPAPWVVTQGGFTFAGPDAFVRIAADGTDGQPAVLEYDNATTTTGGGATISPAIVAENVAGAAGTIALPYDFSGLHAWFAVNVRLEAFVSSDSGTTYETLYAPPQQNCCATPSNGFSDSGIASFTVGAGDTYGFRITGSNGDLNSILRGRLVIGTATVAQDDPPEVTLLAAARDVQAGTLDALGRLVGVPGTAYLLSVAGADATQVECEATTAANRLVPVVTDAEGVVDFGINLLASDFATDADPGGTLPERLAVIAADQLDVDAVDVGDETIEYQPRVVTRYDPSNGFAGSNCVFVGFGNDAWTSALLVGDGELVDDVIEQPGGTRWYRFEVRPNGRATIDLSALPDDYDLAVFTDIDQEYTDLTTAEPDDALNRLGAEFAPSAFSPSAFSPSAFSPSAFSPSAFSPSAFSPSAFSSSVYAPSAFSPSAFSPSAFSPSAFSPSAFSPSAFSPSAFSDAGFSPSAFSPSAFSPSAFSPEASSPSAFSPSAFSPSAFSPSAFSPEAYASAQAQALITVSANPGTTDELAVVNTWNNDTSFYVRVTAKPEAADATPYNLQVDLEGTSCTAVSRTPTALPALEPVTGGPYRTVIVWDSSRLLGSEGELLAVANRLGDLSTATQGVVVDLADHPRVQAYQQQADQNPQCVYAANLVADAIKEVIDTARPAVEHVVLVGDDSVVPFFRYPDTALLGPESDYVPPVRDDTRSQAALRENYVLGQDQYGASTILSLGGMQVPVPELAVGRLVETPDEIIGMIDQFLDPQAMTPTPRAAVRPDSALVTGYDFMEDAAETIRTEFAAGMDVLETEVDALIAPADQAPGDPLAWTADDLYDAWLQPAVKHDVIYLAGHFSANSALAADYQTQLVTTEVAASGVDLAGTVIFSNGCHSGYNIVDGDGIDGLTLGLDWAQAMAQERATFIGGTGYQYGDTELVEYSERLYANFARELRRGTGEVAVGEALVRAKREYLASTPDPRGLHRKSLLIATVFGLPMTAVDMPGQRFVDDDAPSGIAPTPVSSGPGAALGLGEGLLQLTSDPATLDDDLDLVERVSTLDVLDDDGLPLSTVEASYLTALDGSTAVQPNEPILPLVRKDVTVSGASLRGVGFRGGTYKDTTGVIPLSSAAGTELRGVHVPFASETFFPMRIATVNYYDALPGGQDRTRVLTTPVQHKVDQVGDAAATRRVFQDLDVALFYSSNTATTANGRTPALAAPPQIGGVKFTRVPNTDDVRVDVGVVGDPAAGIQRVWLTTTTGPDPTTGIGEWEYVPLTRSASDSRIWGAILPGVAAPGARPVDVVAHAVNGVGLVSTDDNFGRYYQTGGGAPLPGEEPPAPTPTALTVTAPASAVVGATVPVTVELKDTQGAPLAGQRVFVSFGSGGRSVTTGTGGTATTSFTATSDVGRTQVTASYRGSADPLLAASSAAGSVNVLPAGTSLALLAVEGGELRATLTDQFGRRVPEVSVFFDLDEDGQADDAVRITDNTGVVRLPLPNDPPVLAIGARFAGTRTLAATDAVLPVVRDLVFTGAVSRQGDPINVAARTAAGVAGATASLRLVESSGVTVERPLTISGGQVSGVFTDIAVGVYEGVVLVMSPAGEARTSPVMLVVYDPNGGSVSGAGWIIPSGDDILPNFTGTNDDKAHFGFNVRYKKGTSTVPEGQARFRYRVGDLRLDGTGFEWLAVTNPQRGIFRGMADVTHRDATGALVTETMYFVMDVRDGGDTGDEFGIKIYRSETDADPLYRVRRAVIGDGSVNVKTK